MQRAGWTGGKELGPSSWDSWGGGKVYLRNSHRVEKFSPREFLKNQTSPFYQMGQTEEAQLLRLKITSGHSWPVGL